MSVDFKFSNDVTCGCCHKDYIVMTESDGGSSLFRLCNCERDNTSSREEALSVLLNLAVGRIDELKEEISIGEVVDSGDDADNVDFKNPGCNKCEFFHNFWTYGRGNVTCHHPAHTKVTFDSLKGEKPVYYHPDNFNSNGECEKYEERQTEDDECMENMGDDE